MISLSYSRISLADIAQKLQLDSPEDAEFIVAKVVLVQGLWLPPSCLTSGMELGGGVQGGDWGGSGIDFAGSASLAVEPGSCQRERV